MSSYFLTKGSSMRYFRVFLIIIEIACLSSGLVLTSNADHLVVLSHGIMGTSKDLDYLADQLERRGCTVLRSKANEFLKSLTGIRTGGEQLAGEIRDVTRTRGTVLRRLSVVGNSLGGLYARYALKLLAEGSTDDKLAGLQPFKMLTIASPHLGVRNWTFVEDYGIAQFIPGIDFIKKIVSMSFFSTGKDIFAMDGDSNSDSTLDRKTLLYKMATDELFLQPLRSFTSRRLYANLNRDFVVPIGTAAFITAEEVPLLRRQHRGERGIVKVIDTTVKQCAGTGDDADANGANATKQRHHAHAVDEMIHSLDSLGWEKVIVNFPGILPLAHNKICALSRKPEWLYSGLLGFDEGQFVMNDAAEWLTNSS